MPDAPMRSCTSLRSVSDTLPWLASHTCCDFVSRTVTVTVGSEAESALDLGEPGRDDYFGHGRIDAMAAVVQVLQAQGLGANLWFHWMVWAGRAGK